jgi:streptogramin lyase
MLQYLQRHACTLRDLIALICVFTVMSSALAQRTQLVIDDPHAHPESLTSTSDGAIYFGSFIHGTIYRALPGAAKATPWILPGPTNLTRGLGVYAHEPSNTLWVCAVDPDPQHNATILRAFDLKTAALKGNYPFPAGGVCNDIAVMHDGTTLVTDTRGGRILALKPGASDLQVWAADPKWVGIDGIAMFPNGDVLFNNVRQNQLVRVAANADGSAGAATILQLSQPIDGPDGLRSLPDGRFVMAENRSGRIVIVRVADDKAAIDTLKEGFKMAPTAVTLVGSTVWVSEAKFAYLNDPKLKDQDPGPFGAIAVPLPPH